MTIIEKHRGDRMTLGELPVGSIVTDKKTRFNNKPIEWLVADHEKYSGTVLLSKDILCCRPFNEPKETYGDADRREYGSNRWSESDIREWLGNEIFSKTFSNRLVDAAIKVLNITRFSECDKKFCEIDDAVDITKDAVFLLSGDEAGYAGNQEALELFKGGNKDKYRIAEACPGLSWCWWLRSPYAGNSGNARIVCTDGWLSSSNAYGGNGGVRPACVISSSAPVKKRKNGGYKFYWKEVTE